MTDTEPRDLAHTCTAGPLCAFYYTDITHASDDDPVDCGHDSCVRMMHEDCETCLHEALAEMAEQAARDAPMLEGICPDCGTQIMIGCPFGAPGFGNAAECANGHQFSWTGRFNRIESEAHILTLADVI